MRCGGIYSQKTCQGSQGSDSTEGATMGVLPTCEEGADI